MKFNQYLLCSQQTATGIQSFDYVQDWDDLRIVMLQLTKVLFQSSYSRK